MPPGSKHRLSRCLDSHQSRERGAFLPSRQQRLSLSVLTGQLETQLLSDQLQRPAS